MGEGARADALRVGDVAHGEDAPVGQAAQPAIGGDAGRAGLHVAGRQVQRLEVRPPADRDQQVTAVDPPCRPPGPASGPARPRPPWHPPAA